MGFTALEGLLTTERLHQKASKHGGFMVPAMHERSSPDTDGPFLVTNMKGRFLPTRTSRSGVVRYGFSLVPVGTDDSLLVELHRSLADFPATLEASRCTSVQEALRRLQQNGLEPRTVVLPTSSLPEILPGVTADESREAMRAQSHVAVVEGVRVLVAEMLPGTAIVATSPTLVGTYTRVGDYLGVLIRHASRGILAVVP